MLRLNTIQKKLLQASAALTLIMPVAASAVVLNISLAPDQTASTGKKAAVFFVGDEVKFRLTNNAPVDIKVARIEVQGGEVLGNPCINEIFFAKETCDFTVRVAKYDFLQVTAENEQGTIRGGSDKYSVGPFRFATYNLSFDRPSFEELVNETSLNRTQQELLIKRYKEDNPTLVPSERKLAEKAIQIQNVAEVIQRTRPDVFVLAEFDNNGDGKDNTAIQNFQKNYLAYAQHESVKSIQYTHTKNFATNTGKRSGYDLDRDGKVNDGPDDAWGFGEYHGQYAFAVFSQYPFDDANVRTFQNFKWKDMPGEVNIKMDDCENPDNPLPIGVCCGESWYSEDAWNKFPLSSKNHVDLPVKLPGDIVVHFLVSHPAPPIFDNVARHNTKRNRAEVDFWNDYIAGKDYFYDDNEKKGGLAENEIFVVTGDLNADPDIGDGIRKPINALLGNALVNTEATRGAKTPCSDGAEQYLKSDDCYKFCDRNVKNETITAVSSLRLDHVIPSKNMMIFSSGIFWPAPGEAGRDLVYDTRLGTGKGVSSDHRLVWIDAYPQ